MKDNIADITILVLTYNSGIKNILKTLKSVIEQKKVNLELIISDDGSTFFELEKINNFFIINDFDQYRILDNKINRGTVNNIKYALQFVRTQYVKFISPGDYFVNEYSVRDALDYFEKSDYQIAFGRALYYSSENSEILNQFSPFNIFPYKYRKFLGTYRKNIYIRNQIKYLDTFLGASVISRTNICKKYIDEICQDIRLAEDTMYLLMIADGIEFGFINEAFIYYEYGTGVSTDLNNKNYNRVFEEVKIALRLIKEHHPELKKTCLYTLKEDDGVVRFFRRISRKLYIIFYRDFLGKVENYFFIKHSLNENK